MVDLRRYGVLTEDGASFVVPECLSGFQSADERMMVDQLPTHLSRPHYLPIAVYPPPLVVLDVGAVVLEDGVTPTAGAVADGRATLLDWGGRLVVLTPLLRKTVPADEGKCIVRISAFLA